MVDELVLWRAETDGVVWRTVGDEVIVMHLGPGQYYALRGVGGAVWQLLAEGPRTPTQLVDALAAEYDTDIATLVRDVDHFLQRLAAARLALPTAP